MKQDASTSISHQIMWERLISIVEEQAQALIRTAFSTSVREAGDLSAGVYDRDGQMLAQAVTGTPGHVNAMADAVAHFIRDIGPDNIHEGDVYITNDPWKGTGHLHDITVVSPSFYNNIHIGYFACTAHVVDIGGRGFGADAHSVYEEGIRIPIMKFADRGEIDATLLSLLQANTREPDQLIGDVHALATCNEIGHRRLCDMLDEFSLRDIDEVSRYILERSRHATQLAISKLKNGSASGEMTIDGYSDPITLCVQVNIEDDYILCDFEGTSPIDRNGINVPLVYTKAYACYALKCAIAPDIPNNAASLAPFQVSAPENCILNAIHPAPVALRHVIGHMIPDTVYGALDKLLPALVPAEGAGTICNFQLSLRSVGNDGARKRSEVLTFNSGGAGARPQFDGLNATAFPSGVMTMPIEATEHTGPVVIWRKELRTDSGGRGQYRGGLGQVMEIGAREGVEFDFSAMFDRVHYPARGRDGGGEGAPTVLTRSDGAALKGKGKQFVPENVRLSLSFPGGAGYGDPALRERHAIARDLQFGYVSAQHVQNEYGLDKKDIETLLHTSLTKRKES